MQELLKRRGLASSRCSLAVVGVATALALGACTQTQTQEHDAESTSDAVRRGGDTGEYPAVVALLDDAGQPFCTGTLIAPSSVLTAAHCFFPPSPALRDVFFGASPEAGSGERAEVATFWLDPDYASDTRFHDLALVTLEHAVAIPPLRVLAEPLAATRLAREVRVIGFGLDGLMSDELRKRTGVARLASLSPELVHLEPGPASPCSGDSGGPVLLETERETFVVGVVSHGDWLCASYAQAVRVDAEIAPFLHPAPPETGCGLASVPPKDAGGGRLSGLGLGAALAWRARRRRATSARGGRRRPGDRRRRTTATRAEPRRSRRRRSSSWSSWPRTHASPRRRPRSSPR